MGPKKHCISQGFSSSSLLGFLPATVSSRNVLCCEELGRLFSIVFLRLIELWVTVFLRVFHHLVFLGYVTSNSIFEKRVVL